MQPCSIERTGQGGGLHSRGVGRRLRELVEEGGALRELVELVVAEAARGGWWQVAARKREGREQVAQYGLTRERGRPSVWLAKWLWLGLEGGWAEW